MTDTLTERITRAICEARCAYHQDAPCWNIHEDSFAATDCDYPGKNGIGDLGCREMAIIAVGEMAND